MADTGAITEVLTAWRVWRTPQSTATRAAQHHTHRQAFLEAFAGEHVDRAEIERIRSAEIELADAASRQLTSAIADISEVLSPAQRETLLEKIDEHYR